MEKPDLRVSLSHITDLSFGLNKYLAKKWSVLSCYGYASGCQLSYDAG